MLVKILKRILAVIFVYTMDIKNTIFNPKFYLHFFAKSRYTSKILTMYLDTVYRKNYLVFLQPGGSPHFCILTISLTFSIVNHLCPNPIVESEPEIQ